jgi:hypothetical protein
MHLVAQMISVRGTASAAQLYRLGRMLSCNDNDMATSVGRLRQTFPSCDAVRKGGMRSFECAASRSFTRIGTAKPATAQRVLKLEVAHYQRR